MALPLKITAILDAVGYLKVSESVVSSNTAMADSALGMGKDFKLSAETQVAAGAKVIASQRAQLESLQQLQAASVAGSDRRIAADVAVAKAQTALNRSMGLTAVSTAKTGEAAKTAERDLGKLTRGAIAGSGVASSLGRSLAFASTGFIAVAGGATIIAESIKQAEGLAAAQRQVDRQLKTSGKSWDQYGGTIDKALLKESHLAGFTRTQLLQAFGFLLRVGGNVKRSLDLTGLAADVARGRSISLQAASIALSKALGGSATALRRLGIIVPDNVTKMQALEYVQKKFAGQAEAGTTESDRLSTSLANAGATIGTVLLPTFDRLAANIANWLSRMQESGRLTKDFSDITHTLGIGFHLVGGAIATVDKITGSFGHTLLLIGEIWAGIKIVGWISSLKQLAITWGFVQTAAEKAAAAEAAAASVSAAGIATGDLRAAALATGGGRGSILSRLGGIGIAGRAGIGAGLAIGGQLLGPQIGGLIGGQAGRTTSSAIQFAGLGAGIGLLAGPEGAAAGAAVGALVGGLMTLIHTGPGVMSTLENDAAQMKKLGLAAHDAALAVTDARLQRLQLQDTLTSQQRAVSSARSAVGATAPGTAARAAAVRRLNEAELALKQTEQQLKVTTDQLNAAQAKQAQIQKQRAQTTNEDKQQILDLAAGWKKLFADIRSGSVSSTKDIDLLMYSVNTGADKASNAMDAFITTLGNMARKSSPHLQKILNQIRDLTVALHGIPTPTDIKVIFQGQGDFRVGPGGGVFPTGPRGSNFAPGSASPTGPAAVTPLQNFQISLKTQIAQAQAQLTKTLADDVKIAKAIIREIAHLIDIGKLVPGTKAYLQALQAEAGAQSTLQQAQQAAAAKQQAAAAAALQLASSYDIPIDLQIAQVRAQMTKTNKDDISILRKIIATAKAVLASGAKNKKGQLAVLQTILQAQQALQSLLGGGDNSTFALPLKLQLALARAQALGLDQTKILQRMKKALERALKASKGNIQRQIDIYNQITSINSQLQQGDQSYLGLFKQASTKALTSGLDLTAAQRKVLRARLSQLGPGGTTPGTGTGAEGYAIDPDTGRPIALDRHHRRRRGRGGGSGPSRTPADWSSPTINVNVYLDGKQITRSVTDRQYTNRRHNPRQRRGPNAGG